MNWRQLKATSGQDSPWPRLINGVADPGMPKRDKGAGLRISGAAINKASQRWCEEVTHPAGTQRGLCSPPAARSPSGPLLPAGRAACPRACGRCHRLALAVHGEHKQAVCSGAATRALKPQCSLWRERPGPGKGTKTHSKDRFLNGGAWMLLLIFVASNKPEQKTPATLANSNFGKQQQIFLFQKLCRTTSNENTAELNQKQGF